MIPASEWKFFEGTEQRLKHLARHRSENFVARWTGAPLPWDPGEIAARHAALLQDLDYPARIESALAMDPSPEQARHLELHRGAALQAVFTTHPDLFPLVEDIESRWAAFRPRVDGKAGSWADIAHVLREHPERETREAAWKAVTPLAESIQADVAELVGRRERLARSLVGEGFPVVAFHFGEMDRSEEVGLLDMLERYTRKPFEAAKGDILRELDLHEIEPWDLEYGFSRIGELRLAEIQSWDAIGAAREQAIRWGFAPPTPVEAPHLPWESHAAWVEIPGDLRVLYRPGSGWSHARAIFRAFGAAAHGAHAGGRRHLLEQDSPAAVQASARLFEGVLDDRDWLAEHTGASEAAIETHLRVQRVIRILELRRHAALTAFENLVYAASDLEPQRLYGDVMEHMLQETRRPEAMWTSHLDLVARPMASGAAVVGALLAAQVRAKLAEGGVAGAPEGLWRRPETGAWIREQLMEPGARWTLEAKTERATGAPLGLAALAAELGVEFRPPTLEENEEVSDAAAADYFRDIDLGS